MAASLRLGTRGSRLAMAQAHTVEAMLRATDPDLDVEIVKVTTSGDRGEREVLGAFVREIQYALLEDRIDVALHCLKDLPTEQVAGLTIAAHLERGDPRDTIISRGSGLNELKPGAFVGSGSARRTAQLAHLRKDLSFRPLVGNVDTRLRKLISGEYDAIVLAITGLSRLGVLDSWSTSEFGELNVNAFDYDTMLPAPGQAVLVLETRAFDQNARNRLASFDHEPTRLAAKAERDFLAHFGGGCAVPVGALGQVNADGVSLEGLVGSVDGQRLLRASVKASTPEEAAKIAFTKLREEGALDLFEPDRRVRASV